MLTEVVDPSQAVPALSAALSGAPAPSTWPTRMRDLLGPLPPDIARAVENWLVATLPRLVARRLDGIAEQVAEEVGAALRETPAAAHLRPDSLGPGKNQVRQVTQAGLEGCSGIISDFSAYLSP